MEYSQELARRLIAHFTFEAGEIPPTLSEFRARVGITLAEFSAFCKIPEFREAVDEAEARYLDTLTVGALLKKYDTGFVKHLMERTGQRDGDGAAEGFVVEVRVVE